MLSRWWQRRKEACAAREVKQMAAGYAAESSVLVEPIAPPARTLGVFLDPDQRQAQVMFDLRSLSVAPFGVKPSRLSLRMSVYHDGTVAAQGTIADRPLVSNFLYAGSCHEERINLQGLVWHSNTMPRPGTALLVEVAGELRLLGPWQEEYKEARFAAALHLVVRNPSVLTA